MALVIPEVLTESCATRQALERFASKWRVLVIYALLDGPQRHATLRRRLEGITQKVLTQTLRERVTGQSQTAMSGHGHRKVPSAGGGLHRLAWVRP